MDSENGLHGPVLRDAVQKVYELTGVTLGPDKVTLLTGRLRRRVRALGLSGLREYIDLIGSGAAPAEEIDALIDAVTTHKTSFFRTSNVWDFVCRTLLPEADARGSLAAWSAASSTGEEAHSIAIACAAHDSHRGLRSWTVTATDVSPGCVAKARAGLYPAEQISEATRMRPSLDAKRHFVEAAGGMLRAGPQLRARMTFRTHNLFKPMEDRFDLVFLRNVIIYFTEDDKQRVIDNVARTIRENGILVIGESESLHDATGRFEYLSPCIFRKRT